MQHSMVHTRSEVDDIHFREPSYISSSLHLHFTCTINTFQRHLLSCCDIVVDTFNVHSSLTRTRSLILHLSCRARKKKTSANSETCEIQKQTHHETHLDQNLASLFIFSDLIRIMTNRNIECAPGPNNPCKSFQQQPDVNDPQH